MTDSTVDFLIYMYRKHPGLMDPQAARPGLAALRYKLETDFRGEDEGDLLSFLPKMPDVRKDRIGFLG